MMVNSAEIEKLAEWIKESNFTVVFTGAGMSTESGIPDFRSQSGWWNKIDPRTVATIEALENNYDLFHEFYSMRIKGLETYQPHQGHRILANWEERGIINSIATQNVDGFHQKAGNKKVDELHGSINTVRCNNCGFDNSMDNFLEKKSCDKCGRKLRPNVVLFGEALPRTAWNKAFDDISKSDLVIIIGTSLQVYPVNQHPAKLYISIKKFWSITASI